MSFWLAVGLIAAFAVNHHETSSNVSLEEFLLLRIQIKNFLIGATLFAITAGLASWARERTRLVNSANAVLLPAIATTTLFGIAAPFFDLEAVDRAFLATLFGVQWLGHLATDFVAGRFHGPQDALHVVIVGTNTRAIALAAELESDSTTAYRVHGFVDRHWSAQPARSASGHEMISDFKDFGAYLKENVVDLVWFSLSQDEFDREAIGLIDQCREQGLGVVFDTQRIYQSTRAPHVDACFGGHGLAVTPNVGRGMSWWIKRFGDVVISAIAIVALSVPLLVIAAAIKLTSPGPVIFKQVRIGFNKRRFVLYKFRTMVENAEAMLPELESRNESDGAAFKIRNDPRITSIGNFLRRTSADELPQLFNVLSGDMSLVGPRPLPLRDYANFSDFRHCRRQGVPPGLTCLWQISGRSTMSYEEWMQADLDYIDRWSIWLDLKILLRTIPVVLSQKGAY